MGELLSRLESSRCEPVRDYTASESNRSLRTEPTCILSLKEGYVGNSGDSGQNACIFLAIKDMPGHQSSHYEPSLSSYRATLPWQFILYTAPPSHNSGRSYKIIVARHIHPCKSGS
jgi:hypothetical protein